MGRSGEGFQGTRQTCRAKRCEAATKLQTKIAASFKPRPPGQHPGTSTHRGMGRGPPPLALLRSGLALRPRHSHRRPIAPSSTPGLRGSHAAPLHPVPRHAGEEAACPGPCLLPLRMCFEAVPRLSLVHSSGSLSQGRTRHWCRAEAFKTQTIACINSACSNSSAEDHCQEQDAAPLAPGLCFEPFLPPAASLKHTWFGSSGHKTQLEMCWEQSGHEFQLPSVPQRPRARQAAGLPLRWPGPHLSRLASSARAGRPGCLCPAGHARVQRVRHCVGAGQHVSPVRAPVGLVQHDNALDGSIMEWCGQLGATGITVNLAWLAAVAGRAGMRSFRHLSRDKPYLAGKQQKHHPANMASIAL